MPSHHAITDQVLAVIIRSSGAMLDDLVLECPGLTWNQVFMAVDQLSREGVLMLTPTGHGMYRVHLSDGSGIEERTGLDQSV